MSKFASGKIYAIKSHNSTMVYIGSTTGSLETRLFQHRKKFDDFSKGGKKYLSSFEVIRYPDNYIELVEDFPCHTKQELLKREGHIIRRTLFTTNKNIPGRSPKEYYDENKIKILGNVRKWYRDNKVRNNTRRNVHHTCSCGGKYTLRNRSTHKKSKIHQLHEEIGELSDTE